MSHDPLLSYFKDRGIPLTVTEYISVAYMGDYSTFEELLAHDPEAAESIIALVLAGELIDDTQQQAFALIKETADRSVN